MEPSSDHKRETHEMIESATVARMYYVDGRTKSEIAKALLLSRFRVARILERALEKGLVEVRFNYPSRQIDIALSSRLQQHLALQHCAVVSAPDANREALLAELGKAASTVLTEMTTAQDVLGFAWARAMEAMVPELHDLPAQAVVQLAGAYPGAGHAPTSIDLVRDIGRATGIPVYAYYAPLLATDIAAANAIKRQTDFLAAQEMVKHVTIGVIGIGAWSAGASSIYDTINTATAAEIAAQGVVAEASGTTIDERGNEISTDASKRCIGVTSAELIAIPTVVAVVFGVQKAKAIRAAVRGGYINGIVTHASLAEELLALPA